MLTTNNVTGQQPFASYGVTALAGLNPVNKLPTKEIAGSTYYRCLVGAFNTYNDVGIYYPFHDKLKQMFSPNGIITDRLRKGLLKGETNHPDIRGLSKTDALNKLVLIDGQLVQHYIHQYELIAGKDDNGKDIILCYAWLKPAGPFGPQLAKSLESPEENVAFSVRSFCKTMVYQGRRCKFITTLLTHDGVTEPGINIATKFDSEHQNISGVISLENRALPNRLLKEMESERHFTFEDFDIIEQQCVGLEDASRNIRMVKDSLGWQKVECQDMLSFIDY